MKKINLGPKLPYWGIFGMKLEKYVIFENQHPQFYQNEFLTIVVNIRIRSAFSENPRSAFSEGLGASSGPLYKVCYWEL